MVAAAVIFPQDIKIKGLSDSKQLSAEARGKLHSQIMRKALAVGIGEVSHAIIDRINIWEANLLAMKNAVKSLALYPDFLLIDGKRHRINLPISQAGIPQGDARCFSIAAASVVAKVTRDRIMLDYHYHYPEYRFDLHKGYGTRKHFAQLEKCGPCPIHRRSFYPLKEGTREPL